MVILDPLFNPLLQSLLNKSPFLVIVILSLFISLMITFAYKYFTNQQEMKRLKEEQKASQQKMKEVQSNPEEMMKIQKEAMKKNMEYFKHSFRATFITLIPVILIFGWMSAHLMYEPIPPSEEYNVTASLAETVTGNVELIPDDGTTVIGNATQLAQTSVTWNLKSAEGKHALIVKTEHDQQTKDVLITEELKYEPATTGYDHSDIKQITINYRPLKPLGELSLFGWHPSWFWLYFLISIAFSIALRKVFKVH